MDFGGYFSDIIQYLIDSILRFSSFLTVYIIFFPVIIFLFFMIKKILYRLSAANEKKDVEIALSKVKKDKKKRAKNQSRVNEFLALDFVDFDFDFLFDEYFENYTKDEIEILTEKSRYYLLKHNHKLQSVFTKKLIKMFEEINTKKEVEIDIFIMNFFTRFLTLYIDYSSDGKFIINTNENMKNEFLNILKNNRYLNEDFHKYIFDFVYSISKTELDIMEVVFIKELFKNNLKNFNSSVVATLPLKKENETKKGKKNIDTVTVLFNSFHDTSLHEEIANEKLSKTQQKEKSEKSEKKDKKNYKVDPDVVASISSEKKKKKVENQLSRKDFNIQKNIAAEILNDATTNDESNISDTTGDTVEFDNDLFNNSQNVENKNQRQEEQIEESKKSDKNNKENKEDNKTAKDNKSDNNSSEEIGLEQKRKEIKETKKDKNILEYDFDNKEKIIDFIKDRTFMYREYFSKSKDIFITPISILTYGLEQKQKRKVLEVVKESFNKSCKNKVNYSLDTYYIKKEDVYYRINVYVSNCIDEELFQKNIYKNKKIYKESIGKSDKATSDLQGMFFEVDEEEVYSE